MCTKRSRKRLHRTVPAIKRRIRAFSTMRAVGIPVHLSSFAIKLERIIDRLHDDQRTSTLNALQIYLDMMQETYNILERGPFTNRERFDLFRIITGGPPKTWIADATLWTNYEIWRHKSLRVEFHQHLRQRRRKGWHQ